jgi:hypothetical protein
MSGHCYQLKMMDRTLITMRGGDLLKGDFFGSFSFSAPKSPTRMDGTLL